MSDAAVVEVRGTNKALALTVDCNSRYVHADPEQGCAIAVAEAARNIVCAGGEPSAVTNCLNFGNPYNPEVYWQFIHAIKGMGKACLKFATPVTGGNVSFYNQSKSEKGEIPVFPTPTIGMVGIISDKEKMMTLDFKEAGHHIFLIGKSQNDINSSEYLFSYCGIKNSPAPAFDLDEEFEIQKTILTLIDKKLIRSAHDVSDGGLIITLFESAMVNNLGFSIDCDEEIRKDAFLFGESQGRVVISVDNDQLDLFVEVLAEQDVDFVNMGLVTAGEIIIDGNSLGTIESFKSQYDNALSNKMNQ